MTATLERATPVTGRAANGGGAARRAMLRWAWRLFRKEWRQQVLILALIVVAVAATLVGSAVATDTPSSRQATFGTAHDLASLAGSGTPVAAQIAFLHRRFGPVDVIEDQTLRVPGTTTTFQLRSQDPGGPYGRPMLSLVSGRYPTGPDEVALTSGLAADLGLTVGGTWHEGGTTRTVVGIVENPLSLLTAFALVAPGEVTAPTKVTVLFDAHGSHVTPTLTKRGITVRSVTQGAPTGVFVPQTIVLTIATVGMLLIALVSVGGFTVLAQRRLRSIGMIESLGATDAHVRLVVRANGAVVGVVGAVVGFVLGIAAWLVYRPTVEQDAHHVIGVFALPWVVIGPSMVLAVLATYLAAARPARAITRVPVVAALAGRPPAPRQVRRSAVPGTVVLVGAGALFSVASANKSIAVLVPAFVGLIAAIILLAPFFLSLLGRVGGWAPVPVRLALRDLARYRARSASALAAISVGILIAVVVAVIAAGRYGNPLDYAGPNLASTQVVLHATGPTTGPHVRICPKGVNGCVQATVPPQPASPAQQAATARAVGAALGATSTVRLESTDADLLHAAKGRNWNGPLYVATPSLLAAFGIRSTQLDPGTDVVSMRPGLATESKMLLVHNGYFQGQKGGPPPSTTTTFPCPRATCLANPVIQELGALPSGTSAPNTLLTEHAVHTLGLHVTDAGWFFQTAHPPTAGQISSARALVASTAGLSLETKSSAPASSEIVDWATVFGIALALGILAMSVGLIRSETGKDLRTLAAAGASSFARRTVTAATAGGLALLGAVLGTGAGYVACVSFYRGTRSTGLAALSYTPVANLLLIVVGMPLLAVLVGWLLAGREPPAMAHQPIE